MFNDRSSLITDSSETLPSDDDFSCNRRALACRVPNPNISRVQIGLPHSGAREDACLHARDPQEKLKLQNLGEHFINGLLPPKSRVNRHSIIDHSAQDGRNKHQLKPQSYEPVGNVRTHCTDSQMRTSSPRPQLPRSRAMHFRKSELETVQSEASIADDDFHDSPADDDNSDDMLCMHDISSDNCEDLADLEQFDNEIILQHLKSRFLRNQPYVSSLLV